MVNLKLCHIFVIDIVNYLVSAIGLMNSSSYCLGEQCGQFAVVEIRFTNPLTDNFLVLCGFVNAGDLSILQATLD